MAERTHRKAVRFDTPDPPSLPSKFTALFWRPIKKQVGDRAQSPDAPWTRDRRSSSLIQEHEGSIQAGQRPLGRTPGGRPLLTARWRPPT